MFCHAEGVGAHPHKASGISSRCSDISSAYTVLSMVVERTLLLSLGYVVFFLCIYIIIYVYNSTLRREWIYVCPYWKGEPQNKVGSGRFRGLILCCGAIFVGIVW